MATTDEFAERIFHAGVAAVDILTIYLGDRLGYYRSLATDGPAIPAELAERTGTNERYAREWLEQQAASSIVELDGDRFTLPPAHAAVLTEPENLAAMAWFPRLLVSAAKALPRLLEAYRTGGGVGWSEFGDDAIEGQMDQNRPLFAHLLAQEWLAGIADVHQRLIAGARVADIACGAGLSSIAIAKAYPNVQVDGFDLDEYSIDLARKNAEAAGVADRCRFEVRDAGDRALTGRYELVIVFEAIHDLSRPVEVLAGMKKLATDDGTVIVMDERVGDQFAPPADDVERLMYGYSTLLCLPASMAEQPSAAVGTVMRTSTLRALAQEAGFDDIEVLPIEHDFFRFYRLLFGSP